MTEAEWQTGSDWARMEEFVRGRATVRRARLCMAAFCRSNEAEFFDPRMHHVLGAVERCADDPEAEAVLEAFQSQWQLTREPPPPEPGPWSWLGQAVGDAHRLLDENWNDETWDPVRSRLRTPGAALAHAVYLCLREKPLEAFTGGEGDAVWYCASAIDRAGVLRLREKPGQSLFEIDLARERLQELLAGLIRDVFGNPFRPTAFAPEWRTGTAVALARRAYEGRDFAILPVLADALQDAGCEEPDILGHCREPGSHVRGCWVLDAILEKAQTKSD